MKNIRPFPIEIAKTKTAKEATAWLGAQSKNIQQVTFVTEESVIAQKPVINKEAFVDPTAVLIGGMIINKGCYIGPNAVVRLDEKPDAEPLIIGEYSNIQDSAVVHSTTQSIGANVIVAHQSIVHGAVVEDNVTIYIQAVVDGNGTVLGKGCFLHQGSYVGKGIKVPPKRYVAPGQKVLTQSEADELPEIPEALLHVREHVLELNRKHVITHAIKF